MVMMRTRPPKSQTGFPCLTDPDLFFAESPADIGRAKELCQGCPAVGACLAGALARAEPWGVWGGELVLRGEVIASKRGRGRPKGSTNRSRQPAVTGV
jgi:WhiB family transcriptional regulator, redox-sensing transcriptional regulator